MRKETLPHSHTYGFTTPMGILESDPHFVQNRLYSQYQEWRGTRYRLGGVDHNGIDCSALVKVIFEEEFGYTLPVNRLSSEAQLRDYLAFRCQSVYGLLKDLSDTARAAGKEFGVNLYDPYWYTPEVYFGYQTAQIAPIGPRHGPATRASPCSAD